MLSHSLKSFSLTLRFFCCAVLLVNAYAADARLIDAKVLQHHLSKPASATFTKAEIAHLQRFYTARNYQPAWITANPESSSLEIAFNFLASAEDEGLDSRDYPLQPLRQLQQQADQSLPAAIELELRTTHAVLMLAQHLFRGRFSATEADPDWHIAQPIFDAVAFLQQAIKSHRLQQSLDNLSPKEPGYQQLKQTLMRYQQHISSYPNWIHIPNTSAIHPGAIHDSIPLIRQRIAQAYAVDGMAEYDIDQNKSLLYYDDELVNAIKAFQIQHGLNADGIIGRNTIRALNIPLAWKIRQLRINMERLRWLPRNLGKRYALVNTAGFRLTAAEQGEHVLSMRIIVGRDYRSTPSFKGTLSHMVLNPYWTIPTMIAHQDLLPKQQKDPAFFTTANIRVFPNHTRDAAAIDPGTIDWHAIKKGFPYVLRQDPGTNNALGRIKFMLSNPFNIYLHDTPSKSLFHKDIRTFSSGCIRLEKPLELAAFSLGEKNLSTEFLDEMERGETMTMHLRKPLPVYLVYITAWVDEQKKVHFSPDIYGRDLRALQHAGW
ncbi:murein L,D-transpeptidase [Nitrosomonas sp. Nm166]|uniref:L,D-transpeptidase family protein n=1 Tax=Nitrosomonas sp. Nm166 TaxID=1881054 RepID=UPI0008F30607|nr:L,D-transpeptidase family protein [Nitrosomonas sp. Nm166]SFD94580.1 Murein L,D-transpeptidase YcbB/YkuD [Nitrosomonas sp. Nm166]